MMAPMPLALCGTLLAAGLAGSLHCVGMCGPILLAFSQAAGARGALVDGRGARAGGRVPPSVEFLAYHAGRLWTYALLGFLAGHLGSRARDGAAIYGWQRPVAILSAALVILAGALLSGILPAPRLEAWLSGCGMARLRGLGWFRALAASSGVPHRFLLGALLGFLPCGLVYAMLALVATLPTPAHAALGMLIFGLGTVPSLTAVLLLGRSIAAWVRQHGTRVVAAALILAGGVMLLRALGSPADHAGHLGTIAPAAGAAPSAATPP